jgi:FkbM family methyltransferase
MGQPTLIPRYLWWVLLRKSGYFGREARMVTGIRWGGFASFGDYLSQRDAPGPAIREYVRLALGNEAVVLDVGANLGSFSLYVCSCGIRCRSVVAFEPVLDTFKKLQANVGRHGFPVRTERLALGAAESDRVIMDVYADSPATAAVSRVSATPGVTRVTTTMTTLDRFVEDQDISSIDLAKLDVEGSELEVIRGAEGTIREGRLKAVCLEVCPSNLVRFGCSSKQLYQALHDLGYWIFQFDERQGRLSGPISLDPFCALVLADVLCVHGSARHLVN